ncbi:hypothetical protein HK102_003190 [Quaeritorhiza haematococci]|nr:hypothetical protein HK102_003190 [Quaeritorhiza haematococci]
MEFKIQEGMKAMVDAEKAMNKKSFFGAKKPDYDSAVHDYEKAANAFKVGKAYDQAVEAYVKAADCHKQLDSLFMAAKALEQAAALAAQQLKKPHDAVELYRRTSDYFLAHGSPDRAAEVLEKAAKAIEPLDVDKAIELYIESCSTYENEDRPRMGTDTFKRTIAMLLRHKRFDKAVEMSHRLADLFCKLDNKPYFHKQALTTVVILLYMGDWAEAGKRFAYFASIFGSFLASEEGKISNDLLEAYESHNAELLQSCLARSQINFLDNEVTRIARELRVPEGLPPVPQQAPGAPAPTGRPPLVTSAADHAAAAESINNLQDAVEEEGFL